MPEIKPISRKKLIAKLNSMGFEGPFRATKHQYMLKGRQQVFIPNPHRGKDIGIPLLKKIMRQIGLEQDEFIGL